MLHKFSTNPVTFQRVSETLWISQPGVKSLPEEKVNGRVPGSFATFALVGRRPGKGICCFPLPLWGWHLFSLSLFPQKPVGAWKYCNPSFLYCLVPLYLFAFSCLEGWRWGNKSCSFHFSLFLKFPLLLYFVFLFAVFTAYRPPSSHQVILFLLCHFPLILIALVHPSCCLPQCFEQMKHSASHFFGLQLSLNCIHAETLLLHS